MGWDIALMQPQDQNSLFRRTRWQLAGWYAGAMGVVLSLFGLGVYEAVAHAHRVASERALESVAGRLHDSLERTLKQPGKLETSSRQLLPDLCLVREEADLNRSRQHCLPLTEISESHTLDNLYQGNYYIHLRDRSGQFIAQAGLHPQGLSQVWQTDTWQLLKDRQGNRYRQISLLLHTQDNRSWGYLQVGRSLKEFDDYLVAVRLILLLGLPLAMLLVGGASWWLAERAMRPIYLSYQQIQQFTADAAHELRTPLAATQATVESVLRLPQLSVLEARETLDIIKRQNLRLSRLVSDLLLLSRLDQQMLTQQQQLCNLQDLVDDIEEELAALAIAKQVKLRTDIRASSPLKAPGVEAQLYRLVFNVVNNAIRYTPVGGQVTIILDRQDSQALIQVKDTGIGIAPEHQSRIFDRFYQVSHDRSRQSDGGGSGLGLAIAQAIAQAHQGSIQVQSQLGKGSVFSIRLPLVG